MIDQSQFSGKNKKHISKCRLLKFLPSILNIMGSMPVVLEVFVSPYKLVTGKLVYISSKKLS